MKIVHISDTHGGKQHSKVQVPDCDVLIHTGDIGGRTTLLELTEFLIWFEKQPAKVKIFIAGNHDLVLDPDWIRRQKATDSVLGLIVEQQHRDSIRLIQNYDVTYLNNKDYVYEGIKFFGSPYSPSFHKDYWAFNADRGAEIKKQWAKIPNDVNVLLTHTPVYNIFDDVQEYKHENEDTHAGCKDLLAVIKKRLTKLKLCCYGHIHDQYGIRLASISNTRRCLFSNGAVLNNRYEILITKPLIITI